MRVRILPYKNGSKSAKALSEGLGVKRLKLEGSNFKPKEGDLIINWGNSSSTLEGTFLNPPERVKVVANKLTFFQEFTNAATQDYLPRHWREKDSIPDDAFPVVCRTVLSGHSGAGIVIASTRDDLVPASLYVEYLKKKDEYRIHLGWVGLGIVEIAVQKKARRLSEEVVDWQVRNHQNGFIYAREGFSVPEAVLIVAEEVFTESGLDFGAVDVIYNEHYDKAYVLEINTAPGLEGQTIQDYVTFFEEYL